MASKEDGSPPKNPIPDLYNKIGKLEAELKGLRLSFENFSARFANYTHGTEDRPRQALAFIIGPLRIEKRDAGRGETYEVTLADLVILDALWSGGLWQRTDIEMGTKYGQWMPVVIPAEAIEKVIEENAEAGSRGLSAETRRTAAVNRP